jgi:hypothetical protein
MSVVGVCECSADANQGDANYGVCWYKEETVWPIGHVPFSPPPNVCPCFSLTMPSLTMPSLIKELAHMQQFT